MTYDLALMVVTYLMLGHLAFFVQIWGFWALKKLLLP